MGGALLCLCLMLLGEAPAFAFAKQDVERDIAAALEQQGIGQGVKVTLFAARTDIMRYSGGTYRVESVRPNPETQKFEAEIAIEAEGTERTVTLQGRYSLMMQVPTPRVRINPGDVIREEDLAWTEVSSERRQRDWVLSVEPLVGKTPKRVLFPNAPVSESSLKTPDLVHKNDPVSMLYRTDFMELRATGTALESGGANEVIRVKNLDSGRMVQATVVRPGEVRVLTPDQEPAPAPHIKEMH